jgi:glycosyltransferase involved in cell wall biosynthesis
MIKILVISHSSVVGSYQAKLDLLTRYDGITVDLIVPPSWNEGGRKVEAETQRYSSFKTHVIPAYRLNHIASYFYHPFQLRRVISEVKPSLIYIEEEPWSVAAWQAVREGMKLRVPVVFFTWENNWRSYKWISEKILRYVLNKVSGAVAGNKDAELFLKQRSFSKHIINLPQYGVDLKQFQKHEAGVCEGLTLKKPVIAYIGRLEREKGVHILLEAMVKVSSKCNLLVIGNGSIKPELISLTEKLNLLPRTQFVDAVPHQEIAKYLSCVDILVLPSLTTSTWKEQFGRILVEAMACGVPVIGSNSGAIAEVIGDAGVIFREGNSGDLAERISILLNNPPLRAEYGLVGKKRVEMNYTNGKISHRLYEYFSKIISHGS